MDPDPRPSGAWPNDEPPPTVTLRADEALIFDSCGNSDPPGGLNWDSHGVSEWPCQVIWCGPEPYSFDVLLRSIAVIIPGDVVSFSGPQLAVLVRRLDTGGSVAISARSNELIDAAAVQIHRMTGRAGNT
jgi:hypothetical protein